MRYDPSLPRRSHNRCRVFVVSSEEGNSSANTNSVATLDTPFANDPMTLADMELLRAKINELITTLRR